MADEGRGRRVARQAHPHIRPLRFSWFRILICSTVFRTISTYTTCSIAKNLLSAVHTGAQYRPLSLFVPRPGRRSSFRTHSGPRPSNAETGSACHRNWLSLSIVSFIPQLLLTIAASCAPAAPRLSDLRFDPFAELMQCVTQVLCCSKERIVLQ